MQFQIMREFLILANTLNYLAASEQLYISQATLSKHIREMEKELGVSLFNRSTRKVELTELGMRMIPYAQRIVAIQDDYTKEVEEYLERLSNDLVIGCIAHWDAVDLSMMTIAFQKQNPNFHLHIITDESEELLSMLNAGTCQFAIIREEQSPMDDGLSRVLLCVDPLYAFLPKNHPLSNRAHISLVQLKNEPFLMGADGSLSYKLGKKACENAQFRPNVIYQGGRPQTFNYLMHGLGVSLMFGNPLGQTESEQSVVRLPLEPYVHANINLVYKDETLSGVGKAFLEFVQQYHFDLA